MSNHAQGTTPSPLHFFNIKIVFLDLYDVKGGNPKCTLWDDVVTYCDLTRLLKYTYINNASKYLNVVVI